MRERSRIGNAVIIVEIYMSFYIATATLTALLTRIENTPPRLSEARFCAPAPITTAEALWASGLSGYDLEEAFDALSLEEQSRYLAGLDGSMSPPDACCLA